MVLFLLVIMLSFSAMAWGQKETTVLQDVGCQERFTMGKDYTGQGNTTVSGLTCLKWSDTEDGLDWSDVGDHNYCRNPHGWGSDGVFCFKTGSEVEYCAVPFCPKIKILDFSADNERPGRKDSNGSYTYASVEKSSLPFSFTLCSAFMVEAWTSSYTEANVYTLLDDNRNPWLSLRLFSSPSQTKFTVTVFGTKFALTSHLKMSPLYWVRTCLSIESNSSKAELVVNGKLEGERTFQPGARPMNLSLLLGLQLNKNGAVEFESTGRTTNFNVFSSALSTDQMEGLTTAGGEMCGRQGDFLSWEEAEWILHSEAKLVEVDRLLDGPCRTEGKMHIFPMLYHSHQDCMELCAKLGGRSPPVTTLKEWETFKREIAAVTPLSMEKLPLIMWTSATEGDVDRKLKRLAHWPKGVEAMEGVWRDYYTGKVLENYTKPWYSSNGDTEEGESSNCLTYIAERPMSKDELREWQCLGDWYSCPCQYIDPPILSLRGVSPSCHVEKQRFALKQFPEDPQSIILVGIVSAQISYDFDRKQWAFKDPRRGLRATSEASQISYALGKHNWTVFNDSKDCPDGENYTKELKLSGCEEGKFTCNDGQCVPMEERCNQLPDCRDKSDERDCRILFLEEGYNKRVPPISATEDNRKELTPVNVNVSLTLFKVVSMAEEEHSIELEFEIGLEWKENRATYQNLKFKQALNALSQADVERLWLPLVIYSNTDQKEMTRLGQPWEWSTLVDVVRQGNFRRSGLEELHEIEIFSGTENSLFMQQSYTREFQCIYQLATYPFDTQVEISCQPFQIP